MLKRFFFVAVIFLFFLQINRSQTLKNGEKGFEVIEPQQLKSYLTFLASDKLEGRETSYQGQKIAAQFIASEFRKLGLIPIGDSCGYFQHFDVEVRRPDSSSQIILKHFNREYVVKDDLLSMMLKDTTVTDSLVFVGYGIKKDSLNSDYANVDVNGKIVLIVQNDTIISGVNQYISLLRDKIIPAVISNAKGIILTGDMQQTKIAFGNFIMKGSFRNIASSVIRRDMPIPVFFVSEASADSMLSPAGITIAQFRRDYALHHQSLSQLVPSTLLTLSPKCTIERRSTENVAGLIEGSDSLLKKEIVVISAHYDHLGIHPVTHAIYHGADDNGSGTASVLELATALTRNGKRPKRSILFLSLTGEEKGLLGSLYYTEHPLFPLENTVTDLNIDMIGRTDKKHEEKKESDYVYIIGADKLSSELNELNVRADSTTVGLDLDYTYNDENDPEQLFKRSDQYNFAKNNIPIIFYTTGFHQDYHEPTDVVEKIDFYKMTKIVKLIYTTAWFIADADHRPILDDALNLFIQHGKQ